MCVYRWSDEKNREGKDEKAEDETVSDSRFVFSKTDREQQNTLFFWQSTDAVKNYDFYYTSLYKRISVREMKPFLFISSLT